MKIVRVNFLNEFFMAIQNFRVSVDHQCQQENFYLRCRELKSGKGESLSSQPASQPIKYFFLWRVHFPAHASICPIRLVKLHGTVDFNVLRDNINYPERPRPVSISTVYLYFELESYATSCC